jgi:hypothetical protein
MRYLVKNTVTGEETICEKVVSCGEDYFIIDSEISYGDWVISKNSISPIFLDGGDFFPQMLDLPQWRKVIATTNKSLDLPMVIDEVEELAEIDSEKCGYFEYENRHHYHIEGFKDGFNKAKEIYSYTKEGMVEFAEYLNIQYRDLEHTKALEEIGSVSELIDLWQEQRTIEILVK